MKHPHFLYFSVTLIINLVCDGNCVKAFEDFRNDEIVTLFERESYRESLGRSENTH